MKMRGVADDPSALRGGAFGDGEGGFLVAFSVLNFPRFDQVQLAPPHFFVDLSLFPHSPSAPVVLSSLSFSPSISSP